MKGHMEREKGKPKKWDILLLLGILAFSGLFWVAVHFLLPEGKTAVVLLDGEKIQTLSLSEDREYRVNSEKGYNIVVVKGGEVSISEADCPDKLCVKHAAVRTAGETIICLPHKLVVEVRRDEQE